VIQLLIVAISGGVWAAMWSLSGRIWRVKDGPDEPVYKGGVPSVEAITKALRQVVEAGQKPGKK